MVKNIIKIHTTAQFLEFLGMEKPINPYVLVLNHRNLQQLQQVEHIRFCSDFYSISLNLGVVDSLKYGRNYYDLKAGVLLFVAAGQSFTSEKLNINEFSEGWSLHFHPDLVRKSSMYEKWMNYSFFSYNIDEALHIGEDERKIITRLVEEIEKEYTNNNDGNTQDIIIANIDLLLSYCNRFYQRQFETRQIISKDTISKFENLLKEYYSNNLQYEFGLPSARYCADAVNLSSNYFNDLLKKETGKSTTDHIHYFIIEKAKDSLISSDMSINELSDQLGFKYPQHFCNLFKNKTGVSPAEFRKSGK